MKMMNAPEMPKCKECSNPVGNPHTLRTQEHPYKVWPREDKNEDEPEIKVKGAE